MASKVYLQLAARSAGLRLEKFARPDRRSHPLLAPERGGASPTEGWTSSPVPSPTRPLAREAPIVPSVLSVTVDNSLRDARHVSVTPYTDRQV
jgi:hypothetical protein